MKFPGCGGYVRGPSGTIQSPGYPKKYPESTICQWMIEVEPDKAIRLEISEFDGDGDCSDQLFVYDDQLGEKLILAMLCDGNACPVSVKSSGRYMHVIFNSNDKYSGRGFMAKYVSEESSKLPFLIYEYS